jgi:monoamine oxidase
LEARDRIGGRVFPDADGVDLGAEFVHGRSPHIFEIADRAGIPLVTVSQNHRYLGGGKVLQSDDFWEGIETVFGEMSKREGQPDTAFSAFLESLSASKSAKESALYYAEGFNAAEAEKLSVQGLIVDQNASEKISGDEQFRFLGGYRQLIEWMVGEASRAEIVLNKEVTRIEWKRRHVKVFISDDESYVGSACIVTLPLGVLQAHTVSFVPMLPEKFAHIDRIVMGKVVRMVFTFRSCFWEDRKFEDDKEDLKSLGFVHSRDADCFPTWWTQAPVRVPTLVAWASGKYAIEMSGLPRDEIILRAKQSMCSLFGMKMLEVEEQIVDVHFHDWDADPFSRGAYAYVAVDGLSAQRELASPVEGTLFFAGEATSVGGHIGTVHGAIATGKRAADEILSTESV